MLSIFLTINYISYGFIICLVNIIELNEINKPNIIELQDNTLLELKQKVNGYVYRVTEEGLNFIDEHYNIIFVHKSNTKKDYRVGEYIEGRIININENFEKIDISSIEFNKNSNSSLFMTPMRKYSIP